MHARMKRHKANATSAQPAAHRVMTAHQHAVMIALLAINVGLIKVRRLAARPKAAIATLALPHATLMTAAHRSQMPAHQHARAPIAMTAETTAAPMAARPAALPATRWPLLPLQRHRARKMAASACPRS